MLKTKTLERGCEPFLVSGAELSHSAVMGEGGGLGTLCLHPACQGKNPSPPLIPLCTLIRSLVTGTRGRHYHPSGSDS